MHCQILGFGLDLNLTINSDMETIVRAMAEPDSGLDIRDRIWLKIPIPKSFLGKDFPDIIWLNFTFLYLRFRSRELVIRKCRWICQSK